MKTEDKDNDTRYILTYIQPSMANTYDIMPGTMFEVERFDSIEEATKFAKKNNHTTTNFIIIPYLEVV